MLKPVQGSQALVALVAGCLLLVQAFTSAWASGAMPLGPRLDAFGNPLCITSTDNDDPTGGHSKLPDCCVLGCSAAVPPLAAPACGSIVLALPLQRSGSGLSVRIVVRAEIQDHNPGSPRAPPLIV